MSKELFKDVWVRHIGVVLAYSIAYVAIHPFSYLMWSVTAGLRLSCLLLVPVRYWPAMIVGELIPVSYSNYGYVDQFGSIWAILNSIPPLLVAAPLVLWFRKYQPIFPAKRLINVKTLILCVTSASLLWSLRDLGIIFLSLSLHDTPQFHVTLTNFVELFVGKYVGLLIVVPLALLFKLQDSNRTWRSHWQGIVDGQMTLDVGVLLIPTLVVLAITSAHASEDSKQLIRMAMFLPVAWMTLKHGWRATAIGGTLVVLCISLMQLANPDADTLPIQAFLAFAMTSLLACGARITALHRYEEKERIDNQRALLLAQQSFYRGEMRMQRVASSLEQAFGAMHLTNTALLERFRPMLPSSEGQRYSRQAALTHHNVYRLVNAIHPVAWRENGLQAALRETVGRVVDESGIVYSCHVKGDGIEKLPSIIQTAVYRLACEAVAYASDKKSCDSISLNLRSGETNGRRWVVLRLETSCDAHDDEMDERPNYRDVANKLGTTNFSIATMREHAQIYGGELHVRTGIDSLRITALLHDVTKPPLAAREPLFAPSQRAFYVG